MIKKFFKDITGITAKEKEEKAKIELIDQINKARELEEAAERKLIASEKREAKKEQARIAKLTPKEIATKKKEPWVDVISFNINKDNIRNGFYELDWNDYFIEVLRQAEYGFDGDPDEEVVNRWFREICLNAAEVEGINMDDRDVGYTNITKLPNGKAEVK